MALDAMTEAHLDALEDALGTKIKNRAGFVSALSGLVSCCGGESEESDDGESEKSGPPDIAMVLGKREK